MASKKLVRTKIRDLRNGYFDLRVFTKQDADGIVHSRNKRVKANNKAAAERMLRSFIVEVQNENPLTQKEKDSRKMSVSTLLDLYIEDMRLAGRAAKTIENYNNRRARIDEAFDNRTINELTVQRIDNFSKALTEATNRHDEDVSFHRGTDGSEIRKLSKNTTYRIQSLLIQAIKWGDKKGYLTDTVTNRITRLPKDSYSELKIPDIENVIQFVDHINQNELVQMHYKVFINLITWCGMRTEEILALKWDNVDLKHKRIRIEKAEVKISGKGRVSKEPKTRYSIRKVIVPDKVLTMLHEWKTFCDTAYPEWVKSRPDLEKVKAYVIVKQEDGSLPYPDTFNHWLKKYRVRHGFERITPHGLRHFYTTYLLIKGVDVKTVSKLLGHSKTSTTLNIYAAITKEGYDKAESVLNGKTQVTAPDSE